MCRLLYIKSKKPFSIAEHLRMFARISKHSKEYQGHGWGCSFLQDNQWLHYKNIKPVWEDEHEPFGHSTLLIAHARSAFQDKDIRVENNMPFFADDTGFLFNGELHGVRIREQGRIGAEKIFNTILKYDQNSLNNAFSSGIQLINNRTRYIRAMNIILATKTRAWISTQFNEDPEYFTMYQKCQQDTTIICSDPYPDEQGWEKIPNKTIREIT